jgi:iron complex outermembrane receptor protein
MQTTHPVYMKPAQYLRQLVRGYMVLVLIAGPVSALSQASWAVEAPLQQTLCQLSIARAPLGDALVQLAKQCDVQVVRFSDVGPAQMMVGPVMGGYTREQALDLLLQGTGLTYRLLNDHTIEIIRPADSASTVPNAPDAQTPIPAPAQSGSNSAGSDKTQGSTNVRSDIASPAQHSFWSKIWGFFTRKGEGGAASESAPSSVSKALALCSLMAVAGGVCAQTASTSAGSSELEEVIVTAEKRGESVQKIPTSVTAFTGDYLKERQIDSVADLIRVAPSIQLDSVVAGFAEVSMRGIGVSLAGIGSDSSVGTSNDGVAFVSPHMANLTMFDVGRVEVLRGPQGTLGGRSDSAGAINVYSNEPTAKPEGAFKATLGSFERLAVEGHISGPLIGDDTLMGRLAVSSDRDDGWLKNTFLTIGGKPEMLGQTDLLQARASLLAKPTDTFDALLIAEAMRDRGNNAFGIDVGPARPGVPSIEQFYGLPVYDHNNPTVQFDQPTSLHMDRDQVTLRLRWHPTENIRLSAITGWADLTRRFTNDIDSTPIDIYENQWGQILSQISQEVTLTADVTDRLDAVVGGLYLRQKGREPAIVGLPIYGLPLGSLVVDDANRLTSWAGYTQLRYKILDNLRLTTGVRYTVDTKKFSDSSIPQAIPAEATDKWRVATPRVSLDYNPMRDVTLYATVARGYKPGGRNSSGGLFQPEFVWNYETGLKADWLDKHLRTNVAAFYMANKNLQQTLTLDPNNPTLATTINANSATIKGIETEVIANISNRLRLNGAVTYLHARYNSLYAFDPLYPELGIRNLSGNQMYRAPTWQSNISASYTVAVGKAWEVAFIPSYNWQSWTPLDIYNNPWVAQKAYGIVDLTASATSSDGLWAVTAFAKNVGNQYYATRRFASVFENTATVNDNFPSRPRTFGVSVERNF